MKDIKSMMIGFLLATCMFLMMGQGSNTTGRYQAWFCSGDTDSGAPKQRMLDTKTGILYAFNKFHMGWHRVSDKTNIFAPPRK